MSMRCSRWIKLAIVPLFALSFAAPASAAEIAVDSAAALADAVLKAKAGDVITIAPGTYKLSAKLSPKGGGSKAKPIIVRARTLGAVTLKSSAVELFSIGTGHWTFENLIIQGVCDRHKRCEHAFHIVGAADRTTIRNNHLRDFNAAIKGNGIVLGAKRRFPSHVLIEGNAFFNAEPRKTARPVTPIDVVGGSHWVIRKNFFADIGKAQGNRVSYAAFLKGNSSHGLMEQNLVICQWKHKGKRRIGLSLGGGGTGKKYFHICVDNDCTINHTNGTIRNNIVMNCSDVALYLNRAKGTKIYNNTLFKTRGIQIRFETSSAEIWNNLISGDIRRRDGAYHMETNNTPVFMREFKNPAAADFTLMKKIPGHDKGIRPEAIRTDFCGQKRPKSKPDLGAIEYSAGACDVAAILREVEKLHPDIAK